MRQGPGLAGGRARNAGERLRWFDESQSQAGRWLGGAGRSPCRTPTSGQQPFPGLPALEGPSSALQRSQGWWCSAVLVRRKGSLPHPPLTAPHWPSPSRPATSLKHARLPLLSKLAWPWMLPSFAHLDAARARASSSGFILVSSTACESGILMVATIGHGHGHGPRLKSTTTHTWRCNVRPAICVFWRMAHPTTALCDASPPEI